MAYTKESITVSNCSFEFLDQLIYNINGIEKYANIALVTLEEEYGRIYSMPSNSVSYGDMNVSRRHLYYVLEGDSNVRIHNNEETEVNIRSGLTFYTRGNSILEIFRKESKEPLRLLCMDDPFWYERKDEKEEITVINKKDIEPIDDICGELREIYSSEDMSLAHIPFKKKARGGLHRHKILNEYYYIVNGNGKLTIGDKVQKIKKDQLIKIPLNENHSAYNPHRKDLEMLVICYPKFDPKDIITD